MKHQIDFPALLQTLNRQDQQFRDQHDYIPTGWLHSGDGIDRDYFNIWRAAEPFSPLQVMRLAQEQIIRDRGAAWSALLDERLIEGSEGLRKKLSGTIRNTSMMATMPREDQVFHVVDGTTPGIYPVRESM